MERFFERFIEWLASILALVAGVQMALVGFFNYDMLTKVFGSDVGYRTVVAVISLGVLYLVGDVWVRVSTTWNREVHA